ncbi:hypothetical protein J3D56_000030 [Erwinia persicina]|uniref:hypothetical protein n=1 Tax=Erwinia persicina TaxID=55211 RepID=UPI0020A14425|nr:hypothetical protein [Erwinia persicina]MCP1436594.1 hypothetical protein [Erwinia persicina]
MSIKNDQEITNSIPVYASTAAAASYKAGEEAYVDLMFLRSHFVVNEASLPTSIPGEDGLQQQEANLVFSKVAAVTLSAGQAKELIKAIEHQLSNLAKI